MIEPLTIESVDRSHLRPTESDGILGQCFEDGLKVKRRATNHLEHFACRRLLLQSFGEVSVAFLQFFEQPHIFDSDDSLVSKCLDQFHLSLGKWLDKVPPNRDPSNCRSFS